MASSPKENRKKTSGDDFAGDIAGDMPDEDAEGEGTRGLNQRDEGFPGGLLSASCLLPGEKEATADGGEGTQLAELLFFAYRAFVAQPDEILADYNFGRAHHRVLHFVVRSPGLQINELLDILGITKQSLGRVLRQLVETGFITQAEGRDDRRVRLLYPTPEAIKLVARLSALQSRMITEALDKCPDEAKKHVCQFLANMLPDAQKEILDAWRTRKKSPLILPGKGEDQTG